MSRIESIRLDHVKKILDNYSFSEPFHHYLKSYFRKNRQIGSKDRKFLRNYCYDWFRLGDACRGDTFELRLLKAIFLCEKSPDAFFEYLDSEVQPGANWSLSIEEKLQFLGIVPEDIFPLADLLSPDINKQHFIHSMFEQPLLWLRAKKDQKEALEKHLAEQQIPFQQHAFMKDAYGLPNGSKPEIEGLAEVQDLNSQKAISAFVPDAGTKIWDCCAASGGKSLALHEYHPDIEMYLSDARENILKNLQERFSRNGINEYSFGLIDLESSRAELSFCENDSGRRFHVPPAYFDSIIADVPCSGSGTWGRVPEQMKLCKEETIEGYVKLQRKIVAHALPFLKTGGQLIYITCSVFDAENGMQSDHFCSQHSLQEIQRQSLEGYPERADNLYVAIFRKDR